MPDARKLQIDASGLFDNLIVSTARLFAVRLRTIRHMDILHPDIDSGKQIFIHKITLTLLVIRLQPFVLIQIHGRNV